MTTVKPTTGFVRTLYKTQKIISWSDYGYQIGGMVDRPTLVGNNAWNNTHIATVGKAMSSREEASYPILRQHDGDYVLAVFGGLLGYSGDNIDKFLWCASLKPSGQIRLRSEISSPREGSTRPTPTIRNSLM